MEKQMYSNKSDLLLMRGS